MDPTRDPDFKPRDPDAKLLPPPDPTSKIPKSGPITPYVLADYNASIDAPLQMKKNTTHLPHSQGNHQRIPLNKSEFQPLSTTGSSEEDFELDDENMDSDSGSKRESLGQLSGHGIGIGVHKNQ